MPQAPITWRDRLRYRWESTLAGKARIPYGPVILACSLCAVLTALVVGLSGDSQLTSATLPLGLIIMTWRSLLDALGLGGGWIVPVLLAVVTIGVLLTAALLTGTLGLALHARTTPRPRRALVVERGHTVVVGWSSKTASVVSSLSQPDGEGELQRVVVLAEQDAIHVEDHLAWNLPDASHRNVVFRRGSARDHGDLRQVSPESANAIVVLADDAGASDGAVLQSVLAITGHPAFRAGSCHVVAELQADMHPAAAALAGGTDTHFVRGDDLVARVLAQSCRQPGISVIYRSLLDRAQAPLVLRDEPALIGRTYREALLANQGYAPLGVVHAGGESQFNPPMRTRLAPGDRLIAIGDQPANALATTPKANRSAILLGARAEPAVERTLLLGWNTRAARLIRELDAAPAAGSDIVVVSNDARVPGQLSGLAQQMTSRRLHHCDGDPSDAALLESLAPADFQQIVVLSPAGTALSQADSVTVMILLHLRHLAEKIGRPLPVISEMLDLHSPSLARLARLDDIVPTTRMIGSLLARVAESRACAPVYASLSSAPAPVIHARLIPSYIRINTAVDFQTLIESAALRGETAIGYRRAALTDDPDRQFGVVFNPDRAEKIRYTTQDQLIVVTS
ncbi:CASTOR/POLLUX-related putative ion channel [Tahibacter amnicola]|uniref:NAD-binding protein n=1 Tax=Tahibacter amnicola TaxID=2976241 RepID=A0ABY6BJJ5_9GAMM|nr:NAD-binding protein [Tahibacter amnicola]UXI69932.1 NAD-binding protein [Tahibacter amnicola]